MRAILKNISEEYHPGQTVLVVFQQNSEFSVYKQIGVLEKQNQQPWKAYRGTDRVKYIGAFRSCSLAMAAI